MENSLLYATHLALFDLLWHHSILNIYAYIPGNQQDVNPKWKIKTKKYNNKTYKYTFDALKYYDAKEDKRHPLVFNFGQIASKEKVPGMKVEVVQLQYEYCLEREIVEKMCQLSDAGGIQ